VEAERCSKPNSISPQEGFAASRARPVDHPILCKQEKSGVNWSQYIKSVFATQRNESDPHRHETRKQDQRDQLKLVKLLPGLSWANQDKHGSFRLN